MGLFRKASAPHLEVEVQPPRVWRGQEVVARVRVLNPDAVEGDLAAGVRCRRNQRRRTREVPDPIFETYDRGEVYSEWRPLEGAGPWELTFAIPAEARRSSGQSGRHAWRVEVRERRSGGRDPRTHASFIVR